MAANLTYRFMFYFFILKFYVKANLFKKEDFVYWPNGTIPFYINPAHFDKEQSLIIMTSLANFQSKTCLIFKPVLYQPAQNRHVMVFENPRGIRKCTISTEGHAKEDVHRIALGYDCLRSPQIDMLIMKALGFLFEHNRASRDVFIDVQFENIEPGAVILFTKEKILPPELRALPYDIDSVMHFGERDFSKNGHRSIIFKNRKSKQNRSGLSKTDLRKIEIIYSKECKNREREAKIKLCENYPVPRRKRNVDVDSHQSLRVNPEITPPPDKILNEELEKRIKELEIDKEVEDLIEHVHKISAKALKRARTKHCNDTTKVKKNATAHDLIGIIEATANYITFVVDKALSNLTAFCDDTNAIEAFQRVRCGYGTGNRCPSYYKSTKSGPVKYSTQHRPIIVQSTKHDGKGRRPQYDSWLRSRNDTAARRKRDLGDKNESNTKSGLDATGNYSEDVVATVTQKIVNFAPVRRFQGRGMRIYGSKEKQPEVYNSNLSSDESETPSSESKKPMKSSNIEKSADRYKERKKEKERERKREDIDEEEERPKSKILKKVKDRKRSQEPETVKLTKENKEFYDERKWPDGVVRYIIEEKSGYDIPKMRARLEEVNEILKEKTCVRLEEISERERHNYNDYLVLDTSADYVTGRVGGAQRFGCLELFEGGQHRQHAAMMVLAMLGFYFEVARHDRDKYIRVHMRHIRADKLHHFEKIRSDATLSLPYDFRSAAHPAWQFWRRVGRTGISSVATYKDQDPDGSVMKALGQNEQLLSDTDIIKINSVYGIQCFKSQRPKKTVLKQ